MPSFFRRRLRSVPGSATRDESRYRFAAAVLERFRGRLAVVGVGASSGTSYRRNSCAKWGGIWARNRAVSPE